MSDRVNQFMDAVKANDAAAVRQLLSAHAAELNPALEKPVPGWTFGETPLIAAVRSRDWEMIDALLDAGADVNVRTKWWAGGFGVFDELGDDPELAGHLIERGAIVNVHAAARLGKLDHLQMLIGASPDLVHARGGDGMLPLHFASTLEVAQFLVSAGADLDAIDVDHESTAAQYMVSERQDIANYLLDEGCDTDILMAAALGDEALVEQHLEVKPDSIRTCVSPLWFPMKNERAGGSIYNWMLGRLKTAHQIAYEHEHQSIYRMLMERSPAGLRTAVACEVGFVPEEPAVDVVDHERIVQAAHGNDLEKVKRMLESGWPLGAVDAGGATALHWAAFHGNEALVGLLLAHGARLDQRDSQHGGTPADWAQHGPAKSWIKTGDYPAVVRLLRASANTSTVNAPPA